MSILEKIVQQKKERLMSVKSKTTLAELKSIIKDIEIPRDFTAAVKRNAGRINMIAEIKKASPSRGVICNDFDHIRIASEYEDANVAAISVLTEEDFFQGKITFLCEVKKISSRPLLRKDFLFDAYQIYEARAHMADAILLMASVLDMKQAGEFLHLSHELGMAVLFEVHDMRELEIALKLETPIIGINNRNLKTLTVDLKTSLTLKKEIPHDKITVSESGIKTRDDVLRIEAAGIDAMLIGTTLMESADIRGKIDQLLGRG
ncbi:MAG: indole-3-glycerol phosphate synthase TrpC [Nitrospirae bacterium]|nr:indole-3-glycerol phosphate synthase TrpC [Nitrospirota bacterium]